MAGDANYPSCVLRLHCNGANNSTTFTDSSPVPKTVTAVSGAKISTAQSKFSGASGLFNGTSDYLSVPDSNDFAFGSGDFLFQTQMYMTSLPVAGTGASSIRMLFSQRTSDTVRHFFGYCNFTGVVTPGFWYVSSNSGSDGSFVHNVTLALSTWYHIALSRSGNTYRLFIDGALVATNTISTAIADIAAPMLIGTGWAGSFYFSGHLDEIEMLKGLPRWTSAFTAPSAEMVDYAGEVAGTIYDDTGAPCARTVRIAKRSTGAVIASTTSNAGTGAYLLTAPTLDEVHRIVLDDSGGTLYNDIIDRVIPA